MWLYHRAKWGYWLLSGTVEIEEKTTRSSLDA